MTSPILIRFDHSPSFFTVMLECRVTGAEYWRCRFPALLWEMLSADDIADLLADAFLHENPNLAADVLFRARLTADIQLALQPEPHLLPGR